MKNNRFVIDTNTLISAALTERSKPILVYEKAKQTGVLLASLPTYNESCDVFIRSKLDKFISIEIRMEIINGFKKVGVFTDVMETITVCRDPKDNKFLELAVAAKAICIVTGDEDFLVLKPRPPDRQAFRGIPIVNTSDFLDIQFQF